MKEIMIPQKISVDKITLDNYNEIVGTKPTIKPSKHPMVKVKVDGKIVPLEYYEIGYVEGQLDRAYNGLWNSEVQEIKLIANSVVVTVKLWYYNPAMHVWQFKSGVGAAPIQTDMGAGATEFDRIKTSAVQMAAPSAESYAIKNAAKKIGNLFGRHLNREFDFDYKKNDNMDDILGNTVENERIQNHIKNAKTIESLLEVEPYLKPHHLTFYNYRKDELEKL